MQQEQNIDHTALARLRQAMPQELDAVILHDPTHQFFLTSFPFEDGYVAVGRQEAGSSRIFDMWRRHNRQMQMGRLR